MRASSATGQRDGERPTEVEDHDRLLHEAVIEATRLARADGGMLYRFDEATGELRAIHDSGIGPQQVRRRLASVRLSLDRGMIGPAVKSRRPVVTGDYLADPSFEHRPEWDELMRAIGLRSFAAAPILVEDRPFGALAIFSNRVDAFGETDVALVNALAGHAGAEIANLQLIERLGRSESELAHRAEVERALREIGGQLAALHESQAVLQYTVDQAARVLSADGAGIELLDEDVGRFHWIYDSTTGDTRPLGDKPGRDNVDPGQGVSWWAVRERGPVWTPDYLAETRFEHAEASDRFVRRNGIRSVLAAPLMTETAVFGTLTVHSRRVDAFDQDDATVAGALATQASLAIQNARLIDQLARDLAERDRLEHELRDSETRYRYLIQSSPDGVWECDADGQFTFWSDSATALLGWTQDELLGIHWSTIVTEDTVARGASDWDRMARSPGVVVRLPLTLKHIDGSLVPCEISAVGVFPDGVFGGGHGLIRDVRTQVRLEGDLRRQAAELASSRERANLARELHDSVTQALFSMGLSIGTIELLLERDREGARDQVARLKELQREALAEMRSLIFELRPGALEEQGLTEALRRHAAAVEGRLGLPVELAAGELTPLDPRVEEALFRIVQEALHNVVKHADASRVRVSLERADGEVRLAIQDDGRGFDPAAVPDGHFGVAGMRSRAEALDGSLEVRSEPGAGTTVAVTIPVVAADPDGRPASDRAAADAQ